MSATTKTAETKAQVLDRLFKENGLIAEDWFTHSQYRIITRSGIEKIQGKNKIAVRFEAVTMSPQFCVVKAIATKGKDDDAVRIETFGSAGFQADGNFPKGKGFQYLYFPEIAEKRALSRVVLKTMGFYELGVFGEDEADDFKQQQAPIDNSAEIATARQRLGNATSKAALKEVWSTLPPTIAEAVKDTASRVRVRIENTIAADLAGMSVEEYLSQSPADSLARIAHNAYDEDRGHG